MKRHFLPVWGIVAAVMAAQGSLGWDVWIADGKTGAVVDGGRGWESVGEAYEKALPVLCPLETDARNPGRFRPERMEEKTRDVGEWEGFAVTHVVDAEQDHQAVLLKAPGDGWHFVYVQFGAWNRDSLGIAPEFWVVDGRPVLANRLPVAGNGGFHMELYWVKDGESGEPKMLDLSAIAEAEKRALPEGGVTGLRSGQLDLRNLAYWTSVWMPGDGGCCPNGGRVEMELAIEETRVAVKSCQWVPGE